MISERPRPDTHSLPFSAASRAIETKPASGRGGPVLTQDPRDDDPLVSKPAERGMPQAALVDAVFSEDVEQCRRLLNAHSDLVNTPLEHSQPE